MSFIKKENDTAVSPLENYKEELGRELTNIKPTTSESLKKELLTKINIP